MTDFGADMPYAKAMDKLVDTTALCSAKVPFAGSRTSTPKRFTSAAGFAAGTAQSSCTGQTFVVEMTIVPTVKTDATQSDKRKGKSVQWQERLR
ncbi:MAG: hypothetical protein IPH37_02555 [Burkholderiales bacterium]|nr:hypothetical protein [Burkholderiales bacterium]